MIHRQRFRSYMEPFGYMNDKMIDNLEYLTKKSVEEVELQMREYHKYITGAVEYRDAKGEKCSREDAHYVWVSTGLTNDYGNIVYIGFTLDKSVIQDRCNNKYFCYFVADLHMLDKNLEKYIKNGGSDTENQRNILLSNIYNLLLIKGEWGTLPEYTVLNELLKLEEARIANDESLGEAEKNCIYNSNKTKFVYNTGLINTHGHDILIVAELDENGNIASRKVAGSKTQLKQDGFEYVDVKPVVFYEDRRDLLLSASVNDFDLEDFERMRHIVEHRKERFPENLNMSDDEIVQKIVSSLEFDLRMTARNPYWAAPFYNIRQNEIQYLLPLYLGSFSEKPALAMVIGKGEHYYEVRTVLSLTAAYANAACLASPPSTWLNFS